MNETNQNKTLYFTGKIYKLFCSPGNSFQNSNSVEKYYFRKTKIEMFRLKIFIVYCIILKPSLAETGGWCGNLWIFSVNLKLQLFSCTYIYTHIYIWSKIPLSHKCRPALYLGLKLHNTHHWSQTLKARAMGAAPTWTSWLSRADIQSTAVLSLTVKREIGGVPPLGRKAQGQAPKAHTERHLMCVGVSLALQPWETQCFVLYPCCIWDAASGTGCSLLEAATHENVHPLLQAMVASGHLYSAAVV